MMEPVGWLLLVVVLLSVGALIGVALRDKETADERARFAEQKRQLQAEWDYLKETERTTAKFWAARTAMREEALRHRQATNVFVYRPLR